MAFLPLFLSVSEKRLVKSASSVDGYDIPDLIQGEKLDIEFQALNRIRFSPTPGGGFTLVSADGLKTAFVYLDNNGDFQCNPVT